MEFGIVLVESECVGTVGIARNAESAVADRSRLGLAALVGIFAERDYAVCSLGTVGKDHLLKRF